MTSLTTTERDEVITKKQAQGAVEAIVNAAEEIGFMRAVEMLRSAEAGLWKHEENTNHDWADWLLEQREKGK